MKLVGIAAAIIAGCLIFVRLVLSMADNSPRDRAKTCMQAAQIQLARRGYSAEDIRTMTISRCAAELRALDGGGAGRQPTAEDLREKRRQIGELIQRREASLPR